MTIFCCSSPCTCSGPTALYLYIVFKYKTEYYRQKCSYTMASCVQLSCMLYEELPWDSLHCAGINTVYLGLHS